MNMPRSPFLSNVTMLLLALVLSSCSSTVADRIEAQPEQFARLSQQDQNLVRNGQVRKGMSMEAVELAWGKPTSTATGLINGKQAVRWLYQSGGSGFSFGLGGGMSHFNNHSSLVGTGVGMSFPISTIPPNTSYVLFSDGQVVAWEDAQNISR
jgi:hypothetical protein